jgi:hypothetical protein
MRVKAVLPGIALVLVCVTTSSYATNPLPKKSSSKIRNFLGLGPSKGEKALALGLRRLLSERPELKGEVYSKATISDYKHHWNVVYGLSESKLEKHYTARVRMSIAQDGSFALEDSILGRLLGQAKSVKTIKSPEGPTYDRIEVKLKDKHRLTVDFHENGAVEVQTEHKRGFTLYELERQIRDNRKLQQPPAKLE